MSKELPKEAAMYAQTSNVKASNTGLPEEAVVYTEMVPTRDGEQLYTLIIKPEAEGSFPVVLARCPYNLPFSVECTKENYKDLHFALNYEAGTGDNYDIFVNFGYVLVYQHCRGLGNSTGEMVLGKDDYNDACDTMDWLRKQDFYNGEVFRYGQSYCGMTAIIDASANHPDLKGIATLCTVSQPDTFTVKSGLFRNGMAGNWNFTIPYAMSNKGFQPTCYNEQVYRTFPHEDIDKLITGREDAYLRDWKKHPRNDDPYWREEAPMHELYKSFEELNVPTLFCTAWFDLFVEQLLKTWDDLPEETRNKSAMLITPYAHAFDFAPSQKWPIEMEGASINRCFPTYAVSFFDHIRKGTPLKLYEEGKVTFFPEAGQKKWYREGHFTNGEDAKVLYLNSDRTLGTEAGDTSEFTYLYNPYNPAMFYGGCCNSAAFERPEWIEKLGMSSPMQPQEPPDWRYDVVSFQMQPFDKEETIKGEMGVELHVRSDCEDTCFYVRACLTKDGITYGIRDDILTLEDAVGDYVPGEEAVLNFKLPAIAWEVKPGDQLRLDVTSSCYFQYSPHTNVKGNQAEIDKPKYAHNTVIFGKSKLTYYKTDLSNEKYEVFEVNGKID